MSDTVSSPAAYIDALGIHAPTYADVLTYMQEGIRAVYGEDVYLESDSQDGQMVALFAKAAHDLNSLAVAVYNSFSPATAQGAGLSTVVKINGITRAIPTNSTADLLIGGYIGAVITNGLAADAAGNQWALPSPIVIPNTGSILVTATCVTSGAIAAQANAINQIQTPTYGWVSVTNPSAATLGEPVETDAALRQRQATAASLPALSVAEGLYAALAALSGVSRLYVVENATDTPDASTSTPPHSIQCVVEGGDSNAIASTIMLKKGQGVNAYGSTNLTLNDSAGVPHVISFTRPTAVYLNINITLKALVGYSSNVGAALVAALIAGLQDPTTGMNNPGQAIYLTKLYQYAYLPAANGGATYDIIALGVSGLGLTPDANGNLILPATSVPMWNGVNVALTVV